MIQPKPASYQAPKISITVDAFACMALVLLEHANAPTLIAAGLLKPQDFLARLNLEADGIRKMMADIATAALQEAEPGPDANALRALYVANNPEQEKKPYLASGIYPEPDPQAHLFVAFLNNLLRGMPRGKHDPNA